MLVRRHAQPAHHGPPASLAERLREFVAHARPLDEAPPHLLEDARELDHVVVRHEVGDHRRAVVVPLDAPFPGELRGEPAAPDLHRLLEDLAHALHLLVRRRSPLFLDPHHVHQQRVEAEIAQQVHALRRSFQALEELGIRLPVPGHTFLHRREGNRLVAGHRQHRPVLVLRLHRREAEAAVPDHHGSDAMPPGDGAIRIPEHLRVVVRVQVHEAGRNDQPARVEHFRGVRCVDGPDRGDAPVLDPDVGLVARGAQPVDDGAALDNSIEFRHPRASSRLDESYNVWQ